MAAYAGRLSFDVPDNASRAGVMLLLHQHKGDWQTVLIERVVHDRDKHSGQISLPGGKLDPYDVSIEACALREANEEIGINKEHVEILGHLSDLYIPVSKFLVTPVIGLIPESQTFFAQPSEVAEIFKVPLSILFEVQTRQILDLQLSNGLQLQNVPYFRIQDKVVWGATAMILNEFITLTQEIWVD
jgi:8-oxo-dGTP pyrophosphatase MutT (NUDIX family)